MLHKIIFLGGMLLRKMVHLYRAGMENLMTPLGGGGRGALEKSFKHVFYFYD